MSLADGERLAEELHAAHRTDIPWVGAQGDEFPASECGNCLRYAGYVEQIMQARVDAALAPIEALAARAESGAGAWGACSHEWVRIGELRAALRDARHATITQVHTEAPDVV